MNNNVLTGFQRVKSLYRDCPYPSTVWRWCMEPGTGEDAPDLVHKALEKIDALADSWPEIDFVHHHIGENHPEIMLHILGQDFSNRRDKLRAAVARAYETTWWYSNVFCDWREALKKGNRVLSAAEKFMQKWEHELLDLAEVRDARGFHMLDYNDDKSMKRIVSNGFDDLTHFTQSTKLWVEGEKERSKSFPDNAPRIFLYLRLSEIYTLFSGKLPPVHAPEIETDSDTSPGREFLNFLHPALIAMGYPPRPKEPRRPNEYPKYPDEPGGSDWVIRDISKYVLGVGVSYENLFRFERGKVSIDYPYLPSVTLLTGLKCVPEPEMYSTGAGKRG